MKCLKYKMQRGVTLLETLLVLSLIAIIMTSSLRLYDNANTMVKTYEARRQLVTLASNIKSLHANKAVYKDIDKISANNLIRMGAVPVDMINKNEDGIINYFAGQVNIISSDVNTAEDAAFEISYPGVDKEVCYRLLTSYIGADYISNVSGCDKYTKTCVPDMIKISRARPMCENLNNGTMYFVFK
ncbi:MAG: prepilin-type N-terminal cleavage/methylation domain-containing protein [Alphaproteobacteria bacterium]|nr:prepilin-type N-terminal cleavage/methylation domain-containing protein [Alphaproteobacteria bacterium]